MKEKMLVRPGERGNVVWVLSFVKEVMRNHDRSVYGKDLSKHMELTRMGWSNLSGKRVRGYW